MMRQLFLVLAAWAAMLNAMSMRRITRIPSGPDAEFYGKVVCCDSDHDSMPELIFHRGTVNPSDPIRNEVWEHQGWNRFSFVFADTGAYPAPPGITIGNAIPFAAGDVDGDGLTDIVCITEEPDSTDPNLAYDDVITIESPDSFSYPSRLSWSYRVAHNFVIPFPTYYAPDLDGDGHKEIISSTPSLGACIWENAGNDSNKLVWTKTSCGGHFAFGDFNKDGRMDFVTGGPHPSVWENSGGDDQYQRVYEDTTIDLCNGDDVFMTHDIDGNGLPEFYVADEVVPRGKIYLYMWEADHAGTDTYRRTLVDSVGFSGTDWGRWSECGDIDGDGIDECIWTTPNIIKMYKVIGNQEPQVVWQWSNDHGGFRSLVSTVYDINNDGYNELITAGNNKISIFEVDAVDLLSLNGGSCSVGDTVAIRWRANTPPRCDSLSLFLRRDSSWLLDTIATGLPDTDTLYRWVVPSGVPDTGRIIVMAYGPSPQPSPNGRGSEGEGLPRLGQVAWQFDISDSAIHFTGSGVAEASRNLFVTRLRGCSPNPFARGTSVNYELAQYGPVELTVHDVSGRLVRRLESGPRQRGFHGVRWDGTDGGGRVVPTGVYFVRLSAEGKVSTGRLTLVR
jgi:hypothetical protein